MPRRNRPRRGIPQPQLPLDDWQDSNDRWAEAEELRLLLKAERLWRAGLDWHDHQAFDAVRPRYRPDIETIHPHPRYL